MGDSRKALVVGINAYQKMKSLSGCVNDAKKVTSVLEEDEDGSLNFDVRTLLAEKDGKPVNRLFLQDQIEELFKGENDIALFYFAGHGDVENTGGYLMASDSRQGNDGVQLANVITLANLSPARNRIIVLDSCHSGAAGSDAEHTDRAELKDGTTIMTAATMDQYAMESGGSGIFTSLFVDALEGAAANLVGEVTPGSVYAHIDQSLGRWKQRPVFKTNVKAFVSLRKVEPPVGIRELRRILEFFPEEGFVFKLDPSFEPERNGNEPEDMPAPHPENNKTFAVLQKFNRLNLLVPDGAQHMWHAAMESQGCRLTALGEHYRSLVAKKQI